jgi:hypothetical protein
MNGVKKKRYYKMRMACIIGKPPIKKFEYKNTPKNSW